MITSSLIPVLSISGHDPTGGAGIQADIESILSQGCHPLSVVTCLTAQDTRDITLLSPQSAANLTQQIDVLFSDIPIRAVKIGLLGSAEIAQAIVSVLRTHQPDIVVIDPVLSTGGGSSLADDNLIQIIREQLLPLATVLTPNRGEAQRLSGQRETSACAEALLATGCRAVLVTGGDEVTPLVYNTLYHGGGRKTFTWERLPQSAHGSGCTLASALTALLAQDMPLEEAVRKAQQYTWNSIKYGFRLGHGQILPYRLFWS
ncbi:bifunctional hydroxymethylpyrimidine kinase/phosphomethylpyrimidine kinase [Methylohalobius crimeensis]|uniref:bifunctional hydroxymethylpyrimidine kinase/phosphomethylpyrimidine kinase n=1 Tax=Methylohalobius crimeensis TaxID=244365 RepID=UPI0003B6B28A|nr:bifunctional hydroxymethylpyrimidine kinase/phosphomethylpyrimidine kinase [Methylohalobius crimeensis]